MEYMVELHNLKKSYGNKTVLSNINLTVSKGEVLTIIGPSGSGKSTLLRCINLLEVPNSGAILIDGESVHYKTNKANQLTINSKFHLSRIRVNVGMVFQHFNLWKHRTVLENIIDGPRMIQRKSYKESVEIAEDLLAKVGLLEKRDSRPDQLSGGQQQRIAIARALAMQPKIMLFDEATSALDPEMVGEVLKVMANLANDGMTMIVVTHEMGFAQRVSNRVLFMEDGGFQAEGTPKEIFEMNKNSRVSSFINNINS